MKKKKKGILKFWSGGRDSSKAWAHKKEKIRARVKTRLCVSLR